MLTSEKLKEQAKSRESKANQTEMNESKIKLQQVKTGKYAVLK